MLKSVFVMAMRKVIMYFISRGFEVTIPIMIPKYNVV